MGVRRLKLGLGVLALMAVFSVAGEWYFGNLSVRIRDKYAANSNVMNEDHDPSKRGVEQHHLPPPIRIKVQNFSSKRAEFEASLSRRLQSRSQQLAKRLRHDAPNRDGNTKDSEDMQENSTRSGELGAILSRIDTCLMSVNMSAHFKNEGLYGRAQANAKDLLTSLRQVIPKFDAPYTVPCWNTRFLARRDFYKGHLLRGSVGDFNFTYNGMEAQRLYEQHLLRAVRWSRGRREMTIKSSSACLPKIFLLGYPKCGSTFLYCLLHRVMKRSLGTAGRCEAAKEPHWWIVPGPRQKVQSLQPDYIPLYLLNFYRASVFRQSNTPTMTIDASPNLMFQWPRYSESESLENYCLLPSLVPVVLPDSKYFVIMRNPVSMLYSAFWFSCTMLGKKLEAVKFRGPDIFHNRITRKIDMFNDCKRQGKPLDLCVDVVAPNMYTPELPNCGRSRLEMGLYYFHVRKWLSVVPRSKIHFFTLEEVAHQDVRVTADVIVDFLELPRATGDLDSDDDMQCNENSQNVVDYKNDPRLKMRNDTRQILVEFFQPYNRMLADLLEDDKFLWSPS